MSNFAIKTTSSSMTKIMLTNLFLLLFTACGGGGGPAEVVDDIIPPAEDIVECNTTLDSYIENLHNYIPSWTELECFTEGAVRLEYPNFVKRMLVSSPSSDPNNVSQTATNSLTNWHSAFSTYGANVSSALLKSAPPFTGVNGEDLTYPLSEENADIVFRSAATMFMHEKQLQRPVVWVNFYPLNDQLPAFNNQAEFEDWVTNRLLPEKVIEAQAAELIKAEYYIPFPIEFEIFFKRYTGYSDGGFADSLSETELLTLAQSVISQIHDTVRPHFNGKLIAHLYNSVAGGDLFFQELTYSQFDEFYIALFPQCDLATTDNYVDAQLDYFLPIVNRDGLPWQLSELTVQKVLFDACSDSDYEAIEADIYSNLFDKLESLDTLPIGIQIGTQDLTTEPAKQVIIDYFNSK
jgi:hypothetical protein